MNGLYWSGGSTSETSKASGSYRFKADAPQMQPVVQCQGLPGYPVQLESRAEEIIGKLTGRTILVISGMGGIGKTTLAKQVFNTISKNFDCTCFVANVNGIASHKLEERIAECFNFGSMKIPASIFSWSKVETEKHTYSNGCDSVDQLRVLPSLEHFGKDSCLIVTTRNTDSLTSYKNVAAVQVYEVDFLDKQNAKMLFCQHAYGLENIPDSAVERSIFEKIVNAIVTKCDGLPLTLEVLGRHLRANANVSKVWEETRDKLEGAEAISDRDERVLASLRASYDALSDEEKDMFSDAAMFFFERPLHKALVAWSSAASANHERNWANLVSRSLVKEVWNGSCYEVWVHEHLRDLVNSIGNGSMASASGDEAKKLVRMLNRDQVNPTTRSLQLSYPEDSHMPLLQSDSLIKLKGLKSIELDRIPLAPRTVNGDVSNKMDNLAVLDLRDCEIPKDFPEAFGNFSNLRMLTLDRLKGLSCLPENFGNLTRLTSLDIGCAGDLTLPESIGKLSALEYLFLTGMLYSHSPEPVGDLSSLPESLGDLSSLLTLKIAAMKSLAALPDSFGRNFRSLKLLTICGCPLLQRLPDSFGCGLPCLEDIFISDCPLLRRLPEFFSKLSGLRRLIISNCSGLEELAESSGNLSALRRLQLLNTKVPRLPASFGLLSTLEELTITGARFTSLPDNFGQLKALRKLCIYNGELKTLPDSLGFLTSLRQLELNCGELQELPDTLGELAQLETFELSARSLHSLPSSMENLTSLHTLKLHFSGAKLVRESVRYANDTNSLRIDGSNLKMLPETLWKLASEDKRLGHLCPVTVLSIDCESLQELPGDWEKFPSLLTMNITAGSLETMPESIGHLRSLETLQLKMPRLRSVPETVARLSSLRDLQFDCDGHDQLPHGFEHFPFGELKLQLTGRNTQVLPTLCDIRTSLKDLNLQSMHSLRKLPAEVGDLASLERLKISSCVKLGSLPDSLGKISSLKHVKLEVCVGLKTLPDSLGKQTEEEECTRTTAIAQRIRLEVLYCPLLDASLRRLGWAEVSGEKLCYERKPTDDGTLYAVSMECEEN